MHKKFDNQALEKKWQEKWRESGIYDVGERAANKEKEYILVEWPYPSGNLHIGHWYAFAVPDIYVRYRRMTGKQVVFPMGFDAFGLPAENAAIKNDLDPADWTYKNIAFMKTQLASMGNAFSWDKTTSSTDPEYFKWTQWMFTKFFEKDIAYRGIGIVNWCPKDNTVLANEQVLADGTCERCGTAVEKREMPQWLLRITNYADRLIDDLDPLDWPEAIKESQRNWIGRSKGAEISFQLSGNSDESVKVFTTRPDTLFGVTYLVLAPEHNLIEKLELENKDEIDSYVRSAKQKDEIERTNANKEKTGVELKGIKAINPANGEEIPVFVADYVLGGYGTGAIMAVPAHDERDGAFAAKFDLSSKNVIDPKHTPIFTSFSKGDYSKDLEESHEEYRLILEGKKVWQHDGILRNSGEFIGMYSEEAKGAIVKKVGGKMTNTYRLRDWSIGRQRYWGVPIPIVYDPEGKPHVIPEEHLPWPLPTDVDFKPTGEPPLAKSVELRERTEKIFGKGWTPEVETMDTFVDSSWYFLRYIDNQNNTSLSAPDKQKSWMPVDLYFGGAEHTTMHLLYSRFWQKALFDLGLVNDSEPYKKRLNRGLVLGPDGNKMSKSKGNVIDPDEQVSKVGSDTVKMYLAFMGPYGEVVNYPWDMGGIAGIRRFLERVNGLAAHITEAEPLAVTKLLHKTIQKVSSDIEVFKFNTAISALMIFINLAEKEGLSEESYTTFIKAASPFAPHLTEELWTEMGHSDSVHNETYPTADKDLAKDEQITIGVQINGKTRGSITVEVEATEEVVVNMAKSDQELLRYLEGQEIKRVVYVPGRILNLMI